MNNLAMTIVSDRPNSKEDSVVVTNVLSIKPSCGFLFTMAGHLAEEDLEFESGMSFSFDPAIITTPQTLAIAISHLVNMAAYLGVDLTYWG